ncbi:Uncharacterized protein OBRU01_19636 [Operophtera brumata]|uniref:Protein sleepless n=1 Tax=Operophtera brumata TaxID=104452 RepID=A0A0L7KWQ6_OPEBR|nr:Uncharacterized protein OBRU01_19636 [Operophtera brumata]
MRWHISFVFSILCWSVSEALLCYNCSSTHYDGTHCGGDFTPSSLGFNTSRHLLVNCTAENAMCFVRSWSSRTHHSWLVQRGCYLPASEDPLPRLLNIPTRAMTCKHESSGEE